MIRRTGYFAAALFLTFFLAGCGGSRNVAPVSDLTGDDLKKSIDRKWVTVRKGDTLFSISFANGHDHKVVAGLNKIKPPYIIYPGQRIRLYGKPTGRKPAGTSLRNRKTTSVGKPEAPVKSPVKWAWPVDGKIIRAYSAKAPRKKGIGIGGKRGQNIKAAASGKVVYSGDGLPGYGNLIIVKHNEAYLSAYAHSLQVFVKEGHSVKRGQKIASMGNNEDGRAMLHFEVRRNGKPVSPVRYLPRR